MSKETANAAFNPTFQMIEEVHSSTHSTITLEPLERGYGHTVGNALRRVLLSSLPGTAITQMRIAGVDHQYSPIDGVTEDALEIGLNLKQVRISSDREDSGILRIQVKGPKEVTAADIACEAGFSIVNPSQPIATVAKGATLDIELVAESGYGYVLGDEQKNSGIGDIVLDALYSPVVQVSYKVEETRVGRRTDYDKVILEIHTDGTISPSDAMKQAARILTRQFSQIYDPVVLEEVKEEPSLSPEEAEVLRLTVEELDLPTRIANALRKGGFKTVGDLVGVSKATVAKVKNLGEKSVVVVDDALQKKGVQLGE